jgi:hypothetical protein
MHWEEKFRVLAASTVERTIRIVEAKISVHGDSAKQIQYFKDLDKEGIRCYRRADRRSRVRVSIGIHKRQTRQVIKDVVVGEPSSAALF